MVPPDFARRKLKLNSRSGKNAEALRGLGRGGLRVSSEPRRRVSGRRMLGIRDLHGNASGVKRQDARAAGAGRSGARGMRGPDRGACPPGTRAALSPASGGPVRSVSARPASPKGPALQSRSPSSCNAATPRKLDKPRRKVRGRHFAFAVCHVLDSAAGVGHRGRKLGDVRRSTPDDVQPGRLRGAMSPPTLTDEHRPSAPLVRRLARLGDVAGRPQARIGRVFEHAPVPSDLVDSSDGKVGPLPGRGDGPVLAPWGARRMRDDGPRPRVARRVPFFRPRVNARHRRIVPVGTDVQGRDRYRVQDRVTYAGILGPGYAPARARNAGSRYAGAVTPLRYTARCYASGSVTPTFAKRRYPMPGRAIGPPGYRFAAPFALAAAAIRRSHDLPPPPMAASARTPMPAWTACESTSFAMPSS